jgi:hypothetical protein
MLCLGDLQHCNGIQHSFDTPRNLANRPFVGSTTSAIASYSGAFPVCDSFFCGENTRPANIWAATSGTAAAYWSRWGYGEIEIIAHLRLLRMYFMLTDDASHAALCEQSTRRTGGA